MPENNQMQRTRRDQSGASPLIWVFGGQLGMREIAFSGQLTEGDYFRIVALTARKTWIVISGLVVVALAIYLPMGGWQALWSDPAMGWTTLAPFILWAVFMYPLLRFQVRRQWRNNKAMQQPVAGVVTEEGITWNVDGLSTARVPWSLLLRYREQPTLVLVYQGLNQVFYFFRHYFATETDWVEFRGLVASRLPRK
jgi:hypothetical protein